MSADHDLERRIADHYRTEAPQRAPDWLLTRALETIDTTPQRRTMLGLPWRLPPMTSLAKLAVGAMAIVAVGFAGLTFLPQPPVGPAATASPSPVTPSPSPGLDPEQIVAEGTMVTFAAGGSGSLLTVWETCEGQFDTACGHAWRLGSGSQTLATGLVGRGDVHVEAYASGDGFVLTQARGMDAGILIAPDGTASPHSMGCSDTTWSIPTEPGRLVWTSGLSFLDTVTGAVCDASRLGGRLLATGVFTADGTLWALVDNETGPDTLTIGRYDGQQWDYHDFATPAGAWTSVLAAAGSTVVVLLANPEASPRPDQLMGLAVTTDAGATWSEVADPDVLQRSLPFSAVTSSNPDDWFSGYTSMAFAGTSALYVADGNGELWRSTDFATFSRVEVAGSVADLRSTGDDVIARTKGDGLVRVSAEGSVEPLTVR